MNRYLKYLLNQKPTIATIFEAHKTKARESFGHDVHSGTGSFQDWHHSASCDLMSESVILPSMRACAGDVFPQEFEFARIHPLII